MGCTEGRTKRGSTPNLLLCGRCRLVRYCPPACQRNDWPTHRLVCGVDLATFANNLRSEVGLLDPVAAPCGARGQVLDAGVESNGGAD
ncbi:hypothetical protein M427DRAFT_138112 [Gonapodya prolifera JEL478]|uniref:MYND-type domain-containing protein n=1 Tax=Gonapodya prolifera (strain JEL478) TaxID=1344416 RepID=A0A139A496_GONPJ|nr:hypothetical protein M427DRAFT_138112 [Gonapodya prolifera JEL478]|eukprot:KXS11499.1 hypothetical protein M427DRAFT_138112 [Gonapodya prolifera JEL478]